MSSKPQALDLVALSRSDPAQFLKAIFNGLLYDEFHFPTSGNNGCIGNFCISEARIVGDGGWGKKLALHLNFGCTPGGYAAGKLNLQITHFHLTARPKTSQSLIDEAGPSILTAGTSIHINRNGDWGRDENKSSLADAMGISVDQLMTYLRNVEGYTQAYMRLAATKIKDTITTIVGVNAGQTAITWNNSDATFD
jgi:hypothetical protein